MKFLTAEGNNFGSHKHLKVNFDDLYLTLIYGDTGSGKSTILDLIPWILFGRTAKNGTVSDVRPWGSGDGAVTWAILRILMVPLAQGCSNHQLSIFRSRGNTSSGNDLYFMDGDVGDKIRGKDLTETQELINKRLGVDYETFNIAAYYNEYSPTRNFFDSNAKQRRELFETLADLSVPTTLAERISDVKKDTRKALTKASEEFNKTVGRLEQMGRAQADCERSIKRWDETQATTIQNTILKAQGFDREKETKIAALETKLQAFEEKKASDLEAIMKKLNKHSDLECATCGSPNKEAQKLLTQYDLTKAAVNPHIAALEQTKQLENTWVEQIEVENNKINPFLSQKDTIFCDNEKYNGILKSQQDQVDSLQHKYQSLTQLNDLNSKLRAKLLNNVVTHIENETNRYLDTHFDGDLRVALILDDSDNLEVNVYKDSYLCSYRQLSKGQKGLLKLCFSISVMKAASNKAGVHFDTLLFDEALDGLDESLKVKSYDLFSELSLEHKTILIIDHNSAFQSLCSSRIFVTLKDNESVVDYE